MVMVVLVGWRLGGVALSISAGDGDGGLVALSVGVSILTGYRLLEKVVRVLKRLGLVAWHLVF